MAEYDPKRLELSPEGMAAFDRYQRSPEGIRRRAEILQRRLAEFHEELGASPLPPPAPKPKPIPEPSEVDRARGRAVLQQLTGGKTWTRKIAPRTKPRSA